MLPKALNMLNFLQKTFYTSLFFRFCYVIYYSPAQQLWSDPMRHWNNGVEFFKFTYNSGMDPKLYQLYMYLLRGIFKDDPVLIAMVTGLLAVGVAYIWYKVARELFYPNEKKALVFGIIFSLIPTLLCIFGYYFNETLLVYVIGWATYRSLKAYRLPTQRNFIYASIIWGIASTAKITALPMALIAVFFMLRNYDKRIRLAIYSFVILAFFIVLTCLHTYKSANIFSPAYTMQMNKIYNKSGYQTIRYDVVGENIGATYIWSSGSFYMDFLEPFGKYHTYRNKDTYSFKINTANGSIDWNDEINKLSDKQPLKDKLLNYYENFVFLTLAGSWPDMNQERFLERVNYNIRFMWLPLILSVLIFTFFIKASKKEMFFVITSFLMLVLFITQDSGIMEARYRKAIEPHLIFSVYIIFYSLLGRGNDEGDESFYTYCLNSAKEFISPFIRDKNLKEEALL